MKGHESVGDNLTTKDDNINKHKQLSNTPMIAIVDIGVFYALPRRPHGITTALLLE